MVYGLWTFFAVDRELFCYGLWTMDFLPTTNAPFTKIPTGKKKGASRNQRPGMYMPIHKGDDKGANDKLTASHGFP